MKNLRLKHSTLILSLLLAMLMVGCGGDSNSPDPLAKKPAVENLEPKVYEITDIYNAILREDLQMTKEAIAAGVNINVLHENNYAVNYAAEHEQIDITLALIEAGAHLRNVNTDGHSVIDTLFQIENLSVSQMEKMEELNVFDKAPVFSSIRTFEKSMEMPISIEARLKRIEMLMRYTDINFAKDFRVNPLHTALNSIDQKDITIKYAVALYLVDKAPGLVNYAVDKSEQTPKMLLTKVLLESDAEKRNAQLQILEKSSVLNFDQIDRNGDTPLHHMAENLQADAVDYLIAKGANKKLKNNNGDKPCKLLKKAGKKGNKDNYKRIKKALGCKFFLGIL